MCEYTTKEFHMSTRSTIGYIDPKDGLFHYIFCHWDGYLSNNGRILRDHYKDLKKVKRLVALGSISSLEPHVSVRTAPKPWTHRYWRAGDTMNSYPQFVKKHTFETPVAGVTVAYHRDRGEDWDSVKPMISGKPHLEEEWSYYYHDGKWYFTMYRMGHTWREIPEGDLKAAQDALYKELGD
jgi:hypothetical protein